jgi:hypothetical protein
MEEYGQGQWTQAEFCQVKGILLPTFLYWRKKYRLANSGQADGFIELRPKNNRPPLTTGCTLTLHYPNGVRIELDAMANLSTISVLLNLV